MTVIVQWTGASATALRLAMRLTNEGFADKLGVSVRAVAKWRAQPNLKPSPLLQQVLDTVLGQLDDTARQRFYMLVERPAQSPLAPTATTSDWLLFAAAESSTDAVLGGDVRDDEYVLR